MALVSDPIGQFLFIAGDVVSYNYVLFHDMFPQLFPLDTRSTPLGTYPSRARPTPCTSPSIPASSQACC